ncbi:hypothetical protein WDV93_01460 [Pantoea ananatis]
MIKAGPTVALSRWSMARGTWEISGERMVNGQSYEVYHNSALTNDNTLGDVLIQHNLQVHIV